MTPSRAPQPRKKDGFPPSVVNNTIQHYGGHCRIELVTPVRVWVATLALRYGRVVRFAVSLVFWLAGVRRRVRGTGVAKLVNAEA